MPTFTTKVAAEVAGVHQQTVIRWAKEGFLKPSVPRRKWEPRKYTERDLVALMIANAAIKFGFRRDDLASMAKMAQKSDEKQQRSAVILACKGFDEFEGFVEQYWLPDVNDPEQAEFIKEFGEEGLILQQVSLYDIVQSMLKTVNEKYVEKKPAGTKR
jgi:DNA-binding transcriptional MerR regulator